MFIATHIGSYNMHQAVETAVAELRPRLEQYLQIQGVQANSSGFFSCIHPGHDDSTPSARIVPNTSLFHCFGCNASGDLFHAAHWIEGLPMHGREFVTETLPHLCSMLGVDFQPQEPSPQDLYMFKLRRLYADVAGVIFREGNLSAAAERGWSDDTCKRYHVGSVDWEVLQHTLLTEFDYSESFLQESDIRPQLFGLDRITFTIHDENAKPVGFAARCLSGEGSKYINTSSDRAPIYSKGQLLYGLWAAVQLRKPGRPVIITEGYADVLTAATKGLYNVVASCGTAITPEHVDALVKAGIHDVVLALDYDEAGRAGTIRALDNVFSGRDGLKVRVFDLSEYREYAVQTAKGEHLDLDEFLHRVPNAVEVLETSQFMDAFEWRLQNFPDDMNPAQLCELAIPLIVNESSNARREDMCKTLAEVSGYRLVAVQRDLDAALQVYEKKTQREADSIKNRLMKALKNSDGPEMVDVISKAHEDSKALYANAVKEHVISVDETIQELDRYRAETLTRTDALLGWDTGWPQLNKALHGLPRDDAFIVVGGSPNVGKSAWVNRLAFNLVKDEAANANIGVLVLTIDDTRPTFFAKAVASDARCPINNVMRPRSLDGNLALQQRVSQSWDVLRDALEKHRLDVKDAVHGHTVRFAEEWLAHFKATNPGKQPVLIIDNFHKLGTGNGQQGDHERFTSMSGSLQRIARKGLATVIVTAEVVKKTGGAKPNVGDLKYTGQIEYDADVVLLVQNEMHRLEHVGGNVTRCWQDGNDIKPIVDIEVPKNKRGSFKGTISYYFDPACAWFEEIDQEQVQTPEPRHESLTVDPVEMAGYLG